MRAQNKSSWPSWQRLHIPKRAKVILFFATGAGLGYLPYLPGTSGSLLGIPFSLALNRIAESSVLLSLVTLAAFIALAAWFCRKAVEIFRGRDDPRIVMDEIAGFLLANFLSPPTLISTTLAFLLFRFFDIIKLFPAGRAEAIGGGAGVILDDLIAGVYTFVTLRLLFYWQWL